MVVDSLGTDDQEGPYVNCTWFLGKSSGMTVNGVTVTEWTDLKEAGFSVPSIEFVR